MISVYGVKTVKIGPQIFISNSALGFWQTIEFVDGNGGTESIKIFFDSDGTPLPVTNFPTDIKHERTDSITA